MQALRRVVTIAALVGLLAGLYYFGGRYLWPPADPNTIHTVGIIEAPEVNVTSRIMGRIAELNLIEGDSVQRGQLVCRIEDVDIRNQLAQAEGNLATVEASLRNAERTMARDKELYARHILAAQEHDDTLATLERSQAAVLAARANVNYFRDQLKDTEVRSPISGTVVSKNFEVGEWVTPGAPILTVDDLSTLWARVDLEETDLGWIHIGSPARLALPTRPPASVAGQVMAIGQEGQYATERDVRRGRQDIRTFYVKVLLHTPAAAKPGMTAEVSFRRDDAVTASSDRGARAD
jgi:RND family efflux transporter MFP subunit